jgi:hypothetical protein
MHQGNHAAPGSATGIERRHSLIHFIKVLFFIEAGGAKKYVQILFIERRYGNLLQAVSDKAIRTVCTGDDEG